MKTISTAATSGGFRGVVRDHNEEIVAETCEFACLRAAYAAAKELRLTIEVIEARIAVIDARLAALACVQGVQ